MKKKKVTARQVGKTKLVKDHVTGLKVPTVGTPIAIKNLPPNGVLTVTHNLAIPQVVPIDEIPFFKKLALGTKLYKKGTPPTQVFQLRRSPQGRLYLYCKSTCEFVVTTTVPVQFTPIG